MTAFVIYLAVLVAGIFVLAFAGIAYEAWIKESPAEQAVLKTAPVLVPVITAVCLGIAAFGSPPHWFYSSIKWIVVASAIYATLCFHVVRQSWRWVVMTTWVFAFQQLMDHHPSREDWFVWDVAAMISFLVCAVAIACFGDAPFCLSDHVSDDM